MNFLPYFRPFLPHSLTIQRNKFCTMSIISQLTQSLSKLLFSLILKMNENEKKSRTNVLTIFVSSAFDLLRTVNKCFTSEVVVQKGLFINDVP